MRAINTRDPYSIKYITSILFIVLFIGQSGQSQEIKRRRIFNVTFGENISKYPKAIDTKKTSGNGKVYFINKIDGFDKTCKESGTGIITRSDGVIVAALFIFRDDEQPWPQLVDVFAQQLGIPRISQEKFKGKIGPEYEAIIDYGENGMDICVMYINNGLNIPFPFKVSK